ncbi:HET-domain-containing protein, partial [Rhizopogon salebrosus TDB-379]
LCSICSALDLCAILFDPEERAIPLGQLTSILDKQDQCRLCRLIAVIVRRSWNLDEKPDIDVAGINCELYAEAIGGFDAYECRNLGILERVLPTRKDLCHRLRIMTSSRSRGVMDTMIAAQSNLFLEIQLLEEDASKVGRTTGLHGRRVGQTVDINLLKRWIHICEHEHRERCETAWWRNPREVLPKSVRVLDVARMAILPAPRSCRYVALSYVWGGPGEDYWTTQANLKQRSRRGGLDISVLPATIQDTIQLVRQLGERYLWIDALCIVQDDPKDKTKQIGVMERIYGKAVFTIFAASGTSVRDPLPGVRPGTRDPKQEIAKIQGLHLAVPLILPSEAVLSSVWNMRGWTYQELMLSRRRIFFTPHHMHFECVKDVFGEDIVAEPIIFPWTVHPLWLAGMGKVMNGVKSLDDMTAVRLRNWGAPADEYMNMIGEYTLRKLTVESDIVDAITAIINAMTKGYHWAGGNPGKAFRFGMPIGDLERALVWQPIVNPSNEQRVAADRNRMSWPSWSWATWRGAVRYDGGEILVGEDDVHSLPRIQDSLVEQWHLVDDDGKLVRQDVWSTGGAGNEDHWAIYVMPKGDIDPRQLIMENAPLRPGTLVFRTSSSYFDVTKTDDIIDTNANYGIHSILSDIPRPSTRVGRIILPCSIRSPTSFEFVVLSRTSGRQGLFDEDRLDEHGIWKRVGYYGCMFYVMAVQKMQDEERMERVGVGVIFDRAWLNSRAEQKVVFLG